MRAIITKQKEDGTFPEVGCGIDRHWTKNYASLATLVRYGVPSSGTWRIEVCADLHAPVSCTLYVTR